MSSSPSIAFVPPRGVELLADAAFSAGFASCDVDGAIPHGRKADKHWVFQEGVHQKYTDENGRYVERLQDHRLAVNHVLDENTPARLRFSQYNNYGLAADDPQRNRRLVRRVTSDRRGTLRLYFNSRNEIRNAATGYGSRWADDNWPHFLIVQEFPGCHPLAGFSRILMTFGLQVLSARQLSGWPTGQPNAHESELTLLMYFLLRERTRPDHMIWVGELLYCNHAEGKAPVIAREQHGIAFYRRLPDVWKNAYPAIGETRALETDVKALLREAIAEYDRVGCGLSRNAEEYELVHWNFGWEIIGHWESELVLSGVSLRGERRDAN